MSEHDMRRPVPVTIVLSQMGCAQPKRRDIDVRRGLNYKAGDSFKAA